MIFSLFRNRRKAKEIEETLKLDRLVQIEVKKLERKAQEEELARAQESYEAWSRMLATLSREESPLIATSVTIIDGTSSEKNGQKKKKSKLDAGLEKLQNVKKKRGSKKR